MLRQGGTTPQSEMSAKNTGCITHVPRGKQLLPSLTECLQQLPTLYKKKAMHSDGVSFGPISFGMRVRLRATCYRSVSLRQVPVSYTHLTLPTILRV